MTTPAIVLNGIGKDYPASSALEPVKSALRNVSLSISAGDRVGVVGKNGSGKSTLLQLIAGLTPPTSGTMQVSGHVTSVMTLGVGLRDEATGRENIYLDGELQGRSRRSTDDVIEEIIAFAELGEFIDYPVRTYSTGMKARLAFAMISQIDPEILIIDEALSVGDAAFSVKASARIKAICALGKIVLIASHSMSAVREICNRCLWLDDGAVVQDDNPHTVTAAYISSVRQADELELLRRFRAHVGERSMSPGWRVSSLETFGDGSLDASAIVYAGSSARIEMVALVGEDLANTTVRIRISRLDGLLVFDEEWPASDFVATGRSLALAVEMTPVVLGAAVYRVDAVLVRAGVPLAERTSVFEVHCDDPPKGAKPMLLYPLVLEPSTLLEDTGQ